MPLRRWKAAFSWPCRQPDDALGQVMLMHIMKALLVLLVPVGLMLVVGIFMMRATGRAQFRQRRKIPESEPLNFRMHGYDADAARAYWAWLGEAGCQAERRFLWADMLYPCWYGGLFLAGLGYAWVSLGQPISFVWLAIPVVMALLGDWLENSLHLQQLARYTSGQPVQAQWIRLASLGTTTKLIFFWLSLALLAALSVWMMILAIARGWG